MYTLLLIMSSAVCSLLLVRYCAVEMTAIIIIMKSSTGCGRDSSLKLISSMYICQTQRVNPTKLTLEVWRNSSVKLTWGV